MTIIYNPTAACFHDAKAVAPTLSTLAGKTIGFIDNAKPNFNLLVDDLAELLVTRHGAAQAIKRGKRGASMPAPPDVIDELANQCDLVIAGSGD
jgi:hypothetical protein